MYNHYNYRVTPNVVAFAKGDVTGDRIPDDVYLTGTKGQDSPFIENITLFVKNGRTGAQTRVPLSDNAGYNPTLFLGDFTGNGVLDVLVSINSGGSGGFMYHYVYSFIGSTPQELFNFNAYNAAYEYDVIYENNYNVRVLSKRNKKTYIIDLSKRDKEYLNEIYDGNGKLKKPITGFVNPLSGLYPIDFNYDGVYELSAYQKIAGLYNADALGYVVNTLGWENNRFVLQNQYVAISGT